MLVNTILSVYRCRICRFHTRIHEDRDPCALLPNQELSCAFRLGGHRLEIVKRVAGCLHSLQCCVEDPRGLD
jgi:hypothetical protein